MPEALQLERVSTAAHDSRKCHCCSESWHDAVEHHDCIASGLLHWQQLPHWHPADGQWQTTPIRIGAAISLGHRAELAFTQLSLTHRGTVTGRPSFHID